MFATLNLFSRKSYHSTLNSQFYQAKEKPLLTQKQKKKRLSWAKEHLNWTPRQWDSVIWSDESRFQLCVGSQKNRVVRRKSEAFKAQCLKRSVKYPASIMVWGCMSGRGVGQLHFAEGIINASKYQKILENDLLPVIPYLQSPEGEHLPTRWSTVSYGEDDKGMVCGSEHSSVRGMAF